MLIFLFPRPLEDILKTCLEDVLKTCLEDVLKTCLQDVFKTSLQDVFKTSWKTKSCYAEDVWKTSSRHVLKTSSRRLQEQQMFAGNLCSCNTHFSKLNNVLIHYIECVQS